MTETQTEPQTEPVTVLGVNVSPTLQKVKYLSLVAAFSLVSFAAVGMVIGVAPEKFTDALLVAWVVSLFVAGRIFNARM